jgi:hypothetical protein
MGSREWRLRGIRPRKRARVVLGLLIYLGAAIAMLGFSVTHTPHLVNAVAYVAGVGGTDTFIARANGVDCNYRGGCRPFTTGVLENGGTSVTWPGKVAPGIRFPVRAPFWPLGMGRTIISGAGDAVTGILGPLVFYILALALWGIPGWVGLRTLSRRRREYAARNGRG